MRAAMLVAACALAWLAVPVAASAATITWDGGAGTTAWMTAANWSGDQLPGASDAVVVGPGANAKVPESPDITIASLRVDGGTLRADYGAKVTLSGAIVVEHGGLLEIGGAFWSNGGTSSVDATSTWRTTTGSSRTQSLTNSGTIDVGFLTSISAYGTFNQNGTLTGDGTFAGTQVIDAGTTTVATYGSGAGTLTSTTSTCQLQGTWTMAATADLTIRPNCESSPASLTQAAGSTLRLTVTGSLRDYGNPIFERITLDADTLQLDGTVVIGAEWPDEQFAEGQVREGTLARTITGTPTLEVAAELTDGPGAWAGSATIDAGELRVAVTETSVPSATGAVVRQRCGSIVVAGWGAATDPDSPVRYLVLMDEAPDTVPIEGIANTVEATEYAEAHEPGTWYVHVRAVDQAGNLGPVAHSGPWIVTAPAYWIGLTTDWNDAANWLDGNMPTAGHDVYIGDGVGPVIGADVTVGCMHIGRPVTLAGGMTLTTDSIEVQAGGELEGGSVVAPRLVADGATVDLSGTVVVGLRDVSMASSNVVFDVPLELDRFDQTGGRLAAPSIDMAAGSTALVSSGRIVTAEFTTAGVAELGVTHVDVATFRQLPGADVMLAMEPTSAFGTWFVDGGTARATAAVQGGIVATGGTLAAHEVGSVPTALSLRVGPLARIRAHVHGPWLVGGAAIVDGTIELSSPVSPSQFEQDAQLIIADDGISGTPTFDWHADQVDPVRSVITPTYIGYAWLDADGPEAPPIDVVLGDAATDGSRVATVAWSFFILDDPIGVSVSFDQSPTAAADTVVDATGRDGTRQQRLTPGTWYAHVRGQAAGGTWGATAHSAPIVVAQPSGTTPTTTTTTTTTDTTTTQPPADHCSNIAGAQVTVPGGFVKVANGTCIRAGSARADTIVGSAVRDVIRALGGNDVVRAGGGNDFVDGGAGNDLLDGGAGADRLIGGTGRDSLVGGTGADVIVARDGVSLELVRCGTGRDVVYVDRRDRVARDCETVRYRRP